MNNTFESKVRAAAVAGWWVIAAAAGLHIQSWLVYLAVASARPGWFLSLWGQDLS